MNLASAMLLDAFENRADVFVLMSNDSDFVTPLRMVRDNLNRKTGIIFPTYRVSKRLISTQPEFTRHIREGSLSAAQLPDTLFDKSGRLIRKPTSW